MFDILPFVACDDELEAVRSFFCDHGHDLADAALRLGGPEAEARVIRTAVRLETTMRVDGRIRRALVALHRLFRADEIADPDYDETDLFSDFDPASVDVEKICLLTDLLERLLLDIGEPVEDWRFADIDEVSDELFA